MTKKDFENITIRRFNVKNTAGNLYYIYKSADDFVEIEADSAQLAIAKSEIKEPFKIVPAASIKKSVLSEEELEEAPEKVAEETPTEETKEDEKSTEDNTEESSEQETKDATAKPESEDNKAEENLSDETPEKSDEESENNEKKD